MRKFWISPPSLASCIPYMLSSLAGFTLTKSVFTFLSFLSLLSILLVRPLCPLWNRPLHDLLIFFKSTSLIAVLILELPCSALFCSFLLHTKLSTDAGHLNRSQWTILAHSTFPLPYLFLLSLLPRNWTKMVHISFPTYIMHISLLIPDHSCSLYVKITINFFQCNLSDSSTSLMDYMELKYEFHIGNMKNALFQSYNWSLLLFLWIP